jgi:hypothetical protein
MFGRHPAMLGGRPRLCDQPASTHCNIFCNRQCSLSGRSSLLSPKLATGRSDCTHKITLPSKDNQLSHGSVLFQPGHAQSVEIESSAHHHRQTLVSVHSG